MSERKSQQELDFERKHEEDLQRLRGLRLIDDDFMAAAQEMGEMTEEQMKPLLYPRFGGTFYYEYFLIRGLKSY